MRVYIGAKFGNKDKVISLSKKLEEKDIINNYNWAFDLKEEESEEDLIESAKKELNAIKDSDCVIFLLPLGRGSHVELGMALACDKQVILCGESDEVFENDPVNFYKLPEIIKVVESYDGIEDKIIELLSDSKIKNLHF